MSSISRRHLMTAAAGLTASVAAPRIVFAQAAPAPPAPF
ncbi:MAG TPA: superoxide dismutase, partial [Afipia sp.]|nr:superoxide dismutase [Afipia sp.]